MGVGYYQSELRDLRGNALTTAAVAVFNAGTTTPATLFSNAAGTVPLVASPFPAAAGLLQPGKDTAANITFYADDSVEYDVLVTTSSGAYTFRAKPIPPPIPPGTYVDTTTAQTVAGAKTFDGDVRFKSGIPHIDPFAFGAVGDNTHHPVSEFYGNLAAAQAAFPNVTGVALTDSIDWAAWQQCVNVAGPKGATIRCRQGKFRFNKPLSLGTPTRIAGGGPLNWSIQFVRDFSGPLVEVRASHRVENVLLMDDSVGQLRTGAAVYFEATFDGSGNNVLNPGFGLWINCRATSLNDPAGAWERSLDFNGTLGWLLGSIPPVRDIVFQNCYFFAGRTVADTVRIRRSANIFFTNGGMYPSGTSPTVTQGVTVDAESEHVHFSAFQNLGRLTISGKKVTQMGGQIGEAFATNSVIINAGAEDVDIDAILTGNVSDASTSGSCIVKDSRGRVSGTLLARLKNVFNGVVGDFGFQWQHSNTQWRNTLGVLSGSARGYMAFNAEHSTTASTLKNDGTGRRGAAWIKDYLTANPRMSLVVADSATADALWSAPFEAIAIDPLPADGAVGLLVRRNVGGAFTLQQVTMGAVDSGGAGFKVLRVAN